MLTEGTRDLYNCNRSDRVRAYSRERIVNDSSEVSHGRGRKKEVARATNALVTCQNIHCCVAAIDFFRHLVLCRRRYYYYS